MAGLMPPRCEWRALSAASRPPSRRASASMLPPRLSLSLGYPSSAVEHGGHENIVAGAIHERHVAHELHLLVLESRHGARGGVGHGAAVGAVAVRPRARVVLALVDLRVGVAELDCDVALELVLEADGLDAGDGLDDGGLAVRDVADGT